MKTTANRVPAFFLAVLAVACWFALIAQFYLIMENRVASVPETIARYFGFFTILTNIIVAFCVTVLLTTPTSRAGDFFSRPTTLTAITVYITIVGVVYNLVLRFLWKPQGLQYVVDELLHTVVPVLFIILWSLYVKGQGLKYRDVLSWLIYPIIYIIFTAVRGEISGYYPYPFIDVTRLGYLAVIINSIALMAAFSGLSLFLVAVAKRKK
jgi:hypothetical protein